MKCSLSRFSLSIRAYTRLYVQAEGYHCPVTNLKGKGVSAVCRLESNALEEGGLWEEHMQMQSKTELLRVPEDVTVGPVS